MPEKTQDLGTIDGKAAAALLLLDHPVELKSMARAGWFKQIEPNCWPLADIVQGRIRELLDQVSYCTTVEFAAMAGLGAERIRQLTAEGALKAVAKNKYHRHETTRAFIQWLRAGKLNKTVASNRVSNARASEIEVRTAERVRKLVALDEAMESNALLCGFVRTEFGGLAARVTRDLALRREIEKAVNDSLARIASRLIEESAALENGRDLNDADGDADAGRMGAEESALRADGGAARSAES